MAAWGVLAKKEIACKGRAHRLVWQNPTEKPRNNPAVTLLSFSLHPRPREARPASSGNSHQSSSHFTMGRHFSSAGGTCHLILKKRLFYVSVSPSSFFLPSSEPPAIWPCALSSCWQPYSSWSTYLADLLMFSTSSLFILHSCPYYHFSDLYLYTLVFALFLTTFGIFNVRQYSFRPLQGSCQSGQVSDWQRQKSICLRLIWRKESIQRRWRRYGYGQADWRVRINGWKWKCWRKTWRIGRIHQLRLYPRRTASDELATRPQRDWSHKSPKKVWFQQDEGRKTESHSEVLFFLCWPNPICYGGMLAFLVLESEIKLIMSL